MGIKRIEIMIWVIMWWKDDDDDEDGNDGADDDENYVVWIMDNDGKK